jgi:hypothetical protein
MINSLQIDLWSQYSFKYTFHGILFNFLVEQTLFFIWKFKGPMQSWIRTFDKTYSEALANKTVWIKYKHSQIEHKREH